MIAVIDYNMGNLFNVVKALEAVGGDVRVIDKPAELTSFDAVLLPGVGHFGDGMEQLKKHDFEQPLRASIAEGKPFLGICLGMQMLLDSSEEAPGVSGLGVFKGKVLRFPGSGDKIPHMGWNNVHFKKNSSLVANLPDDDYFYFVHSYYAAPEDSDVVVGSCYYITQFAAILGQDNILATQFHPEKSQSSGLKLLENFVNTANAYSKKK